MGDMQPMWIAQHIGWRYIDARRGYFRTLRIVSASPEIKPEANEAAFWGIAGLLTYGLTAPLWVPFFLLVFIGRFLDDLPGGWLPDFEDKRQSAWMRARTKVPTQEMRRRIGEETPRILSKKAAMKQPESP